MKLLIKSIVIGERSRKEIAHIEQLAQSIERSGLLQPPVVRHDIRLGYLLVAGHRRIEAAKHLGWSEIDVTVAANLKDELAALLAEGDENTEREPFTVAEAVEHRRRIRVVEEGLAKERQRDHGGTAPGKPSNTSTKLVEVKPAKRHQSETRHRAAKATGYSATTLDKAEQIIAAAADTTQPAPVQEAAKTAAANLSYDGAKVDREFKNWQAERVKHNPDAARLEFQKNLTKACGPLLELTRFPVERVAELGDADHQNVIDMSVRALTLWHEQLTKARGPRGLRVVNGGQQ